MHDQRPSRPQLLQKDPRDRLGSSARDGEEVKEQEFFRAIDWDLIAKRAISPPFKPKVVSVWVGGRERKGRVREKIQRERPTPSVYNLP